MGRLANVLGALSSGVESAFQLQLYRDEQEREERRALADQKWKERMLEVQQANRAEDVEFRKSQAEAENEFRSTQLEMAQTTLDARLEEVGLQREMNEMMRKQKEQGADYDRYLESIKVIDSKRKNFLENSMTTGVSEQERDQMLRDLDVEELRMKTQFLNWKPWENLEGAEKESFDAILQASGGDEVEAFYEYKFNTTDDPGGTVEGAGAGQSRSQPEPKQVVEQINQAAGKQVLTEQDIASAKSSDELLQLLSERMGGEAFQTVGQELLSQLSSIVGTARKGPRPTSFKTFLEEGASGRQF